MSGRKRPWSVVLTDEAERDFSHVLRWTAEQFGSAQATRYLAAVSAAIEDLSDGPEVAGAKARDEVAPGVMALHVRRRHRKARHVLYFRAPKRSREVVILRILHDAMDPGLHIEA